FDPSFLPPVAVRSVVERVHQGISARVSVADKRADVVGEWEGWRIEGSLRSGPAIWLLISGLLLLAKIGVEEPRAKAVIWFRILVGDPGSGLVRAPWAECARSGGLRRIWLPCLSRSLSHSLDPV